MLLSKDVLINEGYDLLKGKKVAGGKKGFKPKSDVVLSCQEHR